MKDIQWKSNSTLLFFLATVNISMWLLASVKRTEYHINIRSFTRVSMFTLGNLAPPLAPPPHLFLTTNPLAKIFQLCAEAGIKFLSNVQKCISRIYRLVRVYSNLRYAKFSICGPAICSPELFSTKTAAAAILARSQFYSK